MTETVELRSPARSATLGAQQPTPDGARATSVTVEAVTKRYGQTVVVDDITLDLPTGGVVALIGPNGAGKSTLLSIMGRLLGADHGRVRVGGLDVATAKGEEIAKRLAVLRQENHLDIRLTVRDLVTFGRYPHSKGRPTADDMLHVERALDYLDLTALADRFLDQLSGGQRQRAFVAMVLCQDADVVLLDEPLNNLDLRHAVSMMGRLRDAARDLGRTIVVVVHDLNVASCYADTIVAMAEGRVVACGPPTEIIEPELLSSIYGLPVAVNEINGQRIATYYC